MNHNTVKAQTQCMDLESATLYWQHDRSSDTPLVAKLREWGGQWSGQSPLFWLEPRLQRLTDLASPPLPITLIGGDLPVELPNLSEARIFFPDGGVHLLADESGRGCRWARYWIGQPPPEIPSSQAEEVTAPPAYRVVLRQDMQRFGLSEQDEIDYWVQEYWRDGALVAWHLTTNNDKGAE